MMSMPSCEFMLEGRQPEVMREISRSRWGADQKLKEEMVAGFILLEATLNNLGFAVGPLALEHLQRAEAEIKACPRTEELEQAWFGMSNMDYIFCQCFIRPPKKADFEFARAFLWKMAIAVQLSRNSRVSARTGRRPKPLAVAA